MEVPPWQKDVREVRPQVVGHPSSDDSGGAGLRMRGVHRFANQDEDDDEEEEGGVDQEPPTEEEKRWGTWLAMASLIDVLSSTGVFITCFSYAYRDAGVSLWCMGIQAISHLLSSLMITLRFCGENSLPSGNEHSDQGLLRKRRRRFLVREQVVSITMGLVMLMSSAGLLFKAFRKIRFWERWEQDQAKRDAMDQEVQWVTEFLAWYGFSMYFVQAAFRFFVARKMRRSIVWHCFVVSVVSLLFLGVMGVAASYQKEWSWKAEPICAIALAFIVLAEAIRIVISHLDDMDTRLRFDPRA